MSKEINLHKPQISVIGSGNVATNLAHALHQAGFMINEIYSRNLENAELLSQQVTATNPANQLNFTNSNSAIFFVAISDAEIEGVISNAIFPEGCIVTHTSGTADLDILSSLHPRCETAVFYPLQTFVKSQIINFEQVPIILESENKETLKRLQSIAESIGAKPYELNSDDKIRLHVAAVFTGNFTNRMLAAADEILNKIPLNMDILKPLLLKSIDNAINFGADETLTGPAKRKDQTTIDRHLTLLKQHPHLEEVYRLLTDQILRK